MSSYKISGLGIENFRIFKDYQYFNIKPLTILTGTNSSGKSTLGKALLLLKHSFDDNKLNRLILNSNVTNLGNINNIMPYSSSENKPIFELFIENKSNKSINILRLEYIEEKLSTFSIRLQDGTLLLKASISTKEDAFELRYKDSYFHYPEEIISFNDVIEKFDDDLHLINEIKSEVLAFIRNSDLLHNITAEGGFTGFNIKKNNVKLYIDLCCKEIYDIGVCTEYYDEDTYSINRDHWVATVISDDLKSRIINKEILSISLHKLINRDVKMSDYYDFDIFDVFDSINSNVLEYNINDLVISKIKYPNIYSVLTSKDIEYKQSLILSSKSFYQNTLYTWIVKHLKLVKPSSEFVLEKSNGIRRSKEGIENFIKIIKGGDWGELIRIEILVDNSWVALSSLGYGTANIILKILQLLGHNNLLIVEEPEANLHPSLQSKLADFIVQSTDLEGHKQIVDPNYENLDIDTSIYEGMSLNISDSFKIIETHSEYFIRRLQYLVAKKGSPLSSDDVQIYYFNNPLEEEFDVANQVIDIKILPNGSLSDNFGTGFMDEADNIALELYMLQYK